MRSHRPLSLLVLCVACAAETDVDLSALRSEPFRLPASPAAAGSGARPAVSTPSAPASVPAAPTASPPTLPAPAAAGYPALLASDGSALGQTDERPRATSDFFAQLGPGLLAAIAADDPARARPFFFPLVAYEQAKQSRNPRRDFRFRLYSAFERDVHRYHRALGAHPERASFVALEVPEGEVHHKAPGSEYNRLGYWRVLGSRLRYRDARGRERSLEITCMISWRGEWYVIHMNGMR